MTFQILSPVLRVGVIEEGRVSRGGKFVCDKGYLSMYEVILPKI